MDLSVVIVSWNTRDLLALCLQALANSVGDGLSVEVLVVDNASSDGSAAMVRERFPWVRLITNEENAGFARGTNQGLAFSQGRYVLLLNSDALLRPGALRTMVAFMDEHPAAGVVGVKLLNRDGSFQASYMRFPTLWDEVLLLTKLYRLFYPACFPSYPPEQSQDVHEADWMPGACLMTRREVLQQVGGLDEGYFMYSEEVDWCWRVKHAGWKLYYLAQAEVVHWGGQSIGQVPLHKRARVYRGKVIFFRKWRGRTYAALFRSILLASTVMKMGLWYPALLAPDRRLRSRAEQNIRSYQLLLKEV